MISATIQLDGELNTFLSLDRRWRDIHYSFSSGTSVKHIIEALRVPHTEVGRIVVNGKQVDFSYLIQADDQINVYPVSLEVCDFVAENSPEELRFLLDNHLGKLATYMRIIGLDTEYHNDYQDDALAVEASQQRRILLTRDRGLLMRRIVQRGYCIRSLEPRRQIVEVIKRFNLADQIRPFKRCLRCNSLLQPVDKQDILDRLEPLTRQYYNEFHICSQCDKIYWKGSHYEHMQNFLEGITKQ